ncbi:tryptophan synthase subunit alpha [Actinocrispum sp. NPDC049592]|uniref:tryptophan synthase subunit alpha n=1 Tax=Actinocrispum sp. NPDC049592 TaxID=3154835 RepID=UPI00342E3097
MSLSRLSDVINGNSRRGDLAVGIYLVPGFPSWSASLEALNLCVRHGVDFIEFPAISDARWSPRTGPVLARALREAEPGTEDQRVEWLLRAPVRVAIVYGSAWLSPDVWSAPLSLRTGVSGYLFETDPPDITDFAMVAAEDGAVVIPAVDATADGLSNGDRRVISRGGGFVYASLGPNTGARSASMTDLHRKRAELQSFRPELPVCAAFGINEPVDVEELRSSGACDGVIIGTAAVARLEEGTEAFARWLKGIMAAAK